MILYVCPNLHKGNWTVSLGLAEALAPATGATVQQPCQECGILMRRIEPNDALLLSTSAIEAEPAMKLIESGKEHVS